MDSAMFNTNSLRQFLVYYDMDSVPPNPEPYLQVLMSSECAVNPYPNGGVGRMLPVSFILSSSWRNTLLSRWWHAGYLSA
jgi:hypothetical protein